MMRPSTPVLDVASHVGPSSPPQTPTPHLPALHRRVSPGPFHKSSVPMPDTHNIKPVGNAHFSYTRPIRPEELSPSSSHSSAEAQSEVQSEADSSEIDDHLHPPISSSRNEAAMHFSSSIRTTRIISSNDANFSVEELSDFGDSDIDESLDVIRPHKIEYAESERSRSGSREPPDDPHLDRNVINNLRNLNCMGPRSSDGSDLDDDQHQAFLQQMRAEKRRKRMSQGSVGKRTISERGSDSDREDLRHSIDFGEAGSSARRLKRRVGDRRSLLFNDPPERIEEMDEPEELDDDGELLAKELPFYLYQSMEVDSP